MQWKVLSSGLSYGDPRLFKKRDEQRRFAIACICVVTLDFCGGHPSKCEVILLRF